MFRQPAGLEREADSGCFSGSAIASFHSVVGIAFTVILDTDGRTLVNSIGPLGNTGSPSTFEDKQVFRAMFEKTATRLSAQEIDSLIESIGE